MTVDLALPEARRLALASQGFAAKRPARPGLPHVRSTAQRLHALQLDSVNVLVRAHYLPLFSRLGPYPAAAMDKLANGTHELVEARGGHQASYVPVELEPLFRAIRHGPAWRDGWRPALEKRAPGLVAAVLAEVTARGPLAAADIADPDAGSRPARAHPRRKDGGEYAASTLLWRGPSDAKVALDGLQHDGVVALAGRRGFDRLYDLRERVLPDVAAPAPDVALRELVRLAMRALGFGTLKQVADYFCMSVAEARAGVRMLSDEGAVVPARVEGWKDAVYMDAGAKPPPRVDAAALLGPFDSLTWNRDRVRRLFGFEFSFEIYVKEAQREYGYYVLPFLLGDELVARVDLKADRKRRTLLVPGAFAEEGSDRATVAAALARELRLMAGWLGLDDVEAGERGNLGRALAKSL